MSLSPEQIEYAGLLVRRAEGDVYACRVLAEDSAAGDDSVGFHAQQAVEKALKVVLVLAGQDFPRTHDLDFLLARVRDLGIVIPERLAGIDWLTPWAADFRYDEATNLDRREALAVAVAALAWASSSLDSAKGS